MKMSKRPFKFLSLGLLTATTVLFQNCSSAKQDQEDLPVVFRAAKVININEGAATPITVGLSRPASNAIQYRWTIVGETASSRFRQVSGTMTIPAGSLSSQLTLESIDDATFADDKSYIVGFDPQGGPANLGGSVSVLVKERLSTPSLVGVDQSIEGGKTGFVTFEIDNKAAFNNEFLVSTVDGSARAGVDFLGLANIRVVIPAGEKKVAVRLDTFDSGLISGDKSLILKAISSPKLKVGSASQANVRLYNKNRVISATTVQIADAEAKEGDDASIKISLNQASPFDVRVNYTMANGTALENADYLKREGQLIIPQGQAQAILAVKTLKDSLYEGQVEDFRVFISSPQNANLGAKTSAIAKIVDGDAEPELAVSRLINGKEGEKALIQLKLSYKSAKDVEFVWSTMEGTAKAADYLPVANRLVRILAGYDTANLEVFINKDNLAEPEEEFFVNLAGFKNAKPKLAKIPVKIASGTLPIVSVSLLPVTEGRNAEAQFKLDRPNLTNDVLISWHTAISSGVDTASIQDLFIGRGYALIPRGQLTTTAYIPTFDDGLDENSENFKLIMDSSSNSDRGQVEVSGSILDNDPEPAVVTQIANAYEGGNVVMRAKLGRVSGRDVRIHWSTADITAKAGLDYTGQKDVVTVIPAGSSFIDLKVPTLSDQVDELSESFEIRINKVEGAQISTAEATRQAQILNSDPLISVAGSAVSEGGVLAFTLNLSFPSLEATKILVQTANGSAMAPGDYKEIPLTEIMIPAGQTQKVILVQTHRDSLMEKDETIKLILSQPSGLRLPVGSVATLGTILGDY